MAADKLAGLAGEHPAQKSLPVLVAPTSASSGFNTLGFRAAPMACWRLEDLRFEFDSSVIKPNAAAEFPLLARLWNKTRAPLSVFGHADPVGDDEYNKTLSGRRATAVYAALVRDVELWEQLYTHPFSTDNWQSGTLPMMRATTGRPDSAPRKDVFRAYMDVLCRDDAGQPFVVDKTNFLGRGADADGKADYQGCSEFNPILLFSRDEDRRLQTDKPERNRQNQPNRRVMVFLFVPGMQVDPARWPCPRAKEGSAGCRAQFWPDADERRAFGGRGREYQRDKDTFACAFYDGMARRSPCEIVRKTLSIRVFDVDREGLSGARYRLTIGEHDLREGNADARGLIQEPDVVAPGRVTLEWASAKDHAANSRFSYRLELFVETSKGEEREVARRQLHNLGYPADVGLEDAVSAFQHDYGISPVDGQLTDETKAKLREVHNGQVSKSGA